MASALFLQLKCAVSYRLSLGKALAPVASAMKPFARRASSRPFRFKSVTEQELHAFKKFLTCVDDRLSPLKELRDLGARDMTVRDIQCTLECERGSGSRRLRPSPDRGHRPRSSERDEGANSPRSLPVRAPPPKRRPDQVREERVQTPRTAPGSRSATPTAPSGEDSPDLRALMDDFFLPSAVRGPVDFCALRRFASFCACVPVECLHMSFGAGADQRVPRRGAQPGTTEKHLGQHPPCKAACQSEIDRCQHGQRTLQLTKRTQSLIRERPASVQAVRRSNRRRFAWHGRAVRRLCRAREKARNGGPSGGRYWARTSDPQLVELVLSQLS